MNSYSMRHDDDSELLHDAIRVVFVELSKLDEILLKPIDEMTVLEKWAVFFQFAPNPKYRETVNKVIESEEVLQVAGNLLMNISQDERERAIFRSRRKYQTDYDSDMATVEDNTKLDIARNLLTMNIPLDQIVKATGLTIKDVESLRT